MSSLNGSIKNMLIDASNGNFICQNEMTLEMRSAIQSGVCKRLVLGKGSWGDLSFLGKLGTPLRSLLIKSESVDWDSVSRLDSLESLDIEKPLNNEVDFSGLKSLKALSYCWDEINASSVLSLSGLEYLKINNFKCSDFESFSGLVSLMFLEVSGGGGESINGISSLKRLRALSLYNLRKLEDVSCLNAMPGLESLEFQSCNKVIFPKSLSGMRSLRRLALLRQKDFQTLRFLDGCKSLEILHVLEMAVKDGDFGFLETMPSLRRVIIQPKRHYSIDTRLLKKKYIDKYGECDVNVKDLIGLPNYFNVR